MEDEVQNTKKRYYFLTIITIVVLAALSMAAFALISAMQDEVEQEKVFVAPTVEKIKTLIPQNTQLFEYSIQHSKNNKHTVFLTTKDLGMKQSQIWILNNETGNYYPLVEGDEYRYIINPIWNPEGDKVAYIKIYPFELHVFHIYSNQDDIIYDEMEHEEKSVFNPAMGFGGETYLEWNDENEILFLDNKAIPVTKYAIGVDDQLVRKVEEVTPPTKNVSEITLTHFSQRDSTWGGEQLGFCETQTIHSAGCTISSIAMVMDYFGADVDSSKLNKFLSKKDEKGYLNGCDVRWNIIPNYDENLVIKAVHFNEYNLERIDYELSLGNPVIVGFNSVPFTNIPHWVVITEKITGNDYLIYDPWPTSEGTTTLSEYGGKFDHSVVYTRK